LSYAWGLGESIEGSYIFSTLSAAVEQPFMGVQYPAVRQFSISTAGGLYGRINFGTIMLGTEFGQADSPLAPTEYFVMMLPPLIIGPGGPFMSVQPGGLEIVEEVSFPGFDLDYASAKTAAEEAAAFGLGGPAGAFAEGPWPTVTLALQGPGLLGGTELSARPPALSAATSATGSIQFGRPLDPWGPAVRFAITQFAVVPEPAMPAMLITMPLPFAFCIMWTRREE
jgi:hypothetical protein